MSNTISFRRAALLATTILAGSAGAAQAADTIIQFGNVNNSNWATGGSWVGGTAPTSAAGVADFNNTTSGTTIRVNAASGAQGLESTGSGTGGAVQFRNNGAGKWILTLSDTFTAASYAYGGTFTAQSNGGTIAFGSGQPATAGLQILSGSIQNGIAVNVSGGHLRLSGANTYTGGTTISGGLLETNSGTALGAVGNSAVTLTGGTLQTNVSETISSLTAASGGTGAIHVASGTLTVNGAVATRFLGGLTLASGAGLALPTGSNAITIEGGTAMAVYSNANATAGNKTSGITNIGGGVNAITGVDDTATISNFGNVRVGSTNSQNLAIFNKGATSGLTNVQIGGWISQSGSLSLGSTTFTVNPQATYNDSVGWSPASAGAMSDTLTVTRNFSNLANQTATVTGAAYDYANPGESPSSVALTNQRVGGTLTQALTISNATTNAAYQDDLKASFGALSTGVTATGSATVFAGKTDSSSMKVGVDTTTAGAKSGTAGLTYLSTGTVGGSPVPGLGTKTTNGSVGVSGNVYDFANPVQNPNPVNLGNVRVGAADSQAITISNATITDASHQDDLNASFGAGTGGASGSGKVTRLLAGKSDGSAMTVSLDTTTAGAKSGSVALSYVSTGTVDGVTNGLGTKTTTGSVGVSGNVYDFANPVQNPNPVKLGNVRVGAADSQAITISNATITDASHQDDLNASFGAGTGGASGSGAVTGLLAGKSDGSAMAVSLDTTTAGAKSGSVALSYVSTGAVNGVSNGLGTKTTNGSVAVSGAVYDFANPDATPASVTFANQHVSGTLSQALTISNTTITDASHQDDLKASFGALSAGVTAGGSATVYAGKTDSSSMTVGVDTTTAGAKSGTAGLTYLSTGTVGGVSNGLGTKTTTGSVDVKGNVYALAAETTTPTAVNLGAFHVADKNGLATNPASNSFTVQNTGVGAAGFVEDLDVGAASAGGFSSTAASDITQGNKGTVNVSLTGGVLGANSDTLSVAMTSTGAVNGVSNGLGSSDLGAQSVDVSATGYHYANPELTQLAGVGTFGGSGTSYTLDFGNVGNSQSVTFDLGVLNALYGDDSLGLYTDKLGGSFTATGPFGLTGFGLFNSLAAGSTHDAGIIDYTVSNVFGLITEVVWLAPASQNPSLPDSGLSPIQLTITLNAVPEPSTWAMLTLGFAGLGFAGWRRVRRERCIEA